MLIENILRKYENGVEKKKYPFNRSKAEIGLILAELFIFIISIVAIFCFEVKGEVKTVLGIVAVFTLLELLLIQASRCIEEKNWERRLKRYEKRLELLEKLLEECACNNDESIDMMIDWCNEYASSDSFWVKTLRPFGVLFTICIGPIIAKWIEELYTTAGVNKTTVVLLAVMIALLFISIVYGVLPALRDSANRRQRLAGAMGKDLKMLRFQKLIQRKAITNSSSEAEIDSIDNDGE